LIAKNSIIAIEIVSVIFIIHDYPGNKIFLSEVCKMLPPNYSSSPFLMIGPLGSMNGSFGVAYAGWS